MKTFFALLLGAVIAVLPSLTEAKCVWVDGGTCGDLSGCSQATEEKYCDNASNAAKKGEMAQPAQCCCCTEEIGCCQYKHKSDNKQQAGMKDRADCFGLVYFAKIDKFDVNAIAITDQKTGIGQCRLDSDPDKSCCECVQYFEKAVFTYYSVENEDACSDLPGDCSFFEDERVTQSGDGCEKKQLDELPTQEATLTDSADKTTANANASQASPTAGGSLYSTKEYKLLPNPIGTTEIPVVAGRLIGALVRIIGALALLIMVYGGWLWLTAMGNDMKIKQGKSLIVWSAIGLLIIFSAYVLVKFVFEILGASLPF